MLSASLNKTFPFLSLSVYEKGTADKLINSNKLHVLKGSKKEMFYLTTHLKNIYIRFHGFGHMVKDHSDSERGNPLSPPHGLLVST